MKQPDCIMNKPQTGHYAFELLPPGDYSARAAADKMSAQLNSGIQVTLGGVSEIHFKLTIAGARESVTVSAEPRALETQSRIGGLTLTPLRAYAHQVPHYYFQRFGPAASHPHTNEYAAFAQDRMRITDHFGLTLGVRYDLQTFTTKYLKTNPLWPDSGKVPLDLNNFAPRAGISYAFGTDNPTVVRIGYGLFCPRIPQIYNSAVKNENGLVPTSIFLNRTNYYDRQIFPQYPYSLVSCPLLAASCTPPTNLLQFAQNDISPFAHNFRTPEVHQASVTVEREIARRVVADISYSFVHRQNLIRAGDENLPRPTNVQYPIFDSSGLNLLGYGSVQTFSDWEFSSSLTWPFPPCINPLARPLPQLGSIDCI
jgi:TonB dependent receptor